MQLNIFHIHQYENNIESQQFLNANKKHLSNNCQMIFDKMMQGKYLTSFNCGIVDFRRRLCDLKENGVKISFKKESNLRYKIWFFSEEDINHNKNLFT